VAISAYAYGIDRLVERARPSRCDSTLLWRRCGVEDVRGNSQVAGEPRQVASARWERPRDPPERRSELPGSPAAQATTSEGLGEHGGHLIVIHAASVVLQMAGRADQRSQFRR